ncbi:MAG: ABC transporter permease [Trueperaceae bacterium]|nr:ABC transporter permease [Trueperaceae bacterium]MCC6310020.1 ABC transporter permease [Trueperaceae bacterium]MCO5175109.1 ABC transporter permease [Trueperaceae bacterium]MCW5818823.1 ABC transporter permease [Trueperaceae bacterium]
MHWFIIKRLLLLPFLLLIFSIVSFALIQAPPGDFLTSYVAELAAGGTSIDQAEIEALRTRYGLDQPIYVQYGRWVGNLLRGDLGVSLEWRRPNSELIGERLVLTLILTTFSLLFTWAVAIPIGIFSATRQYSLLDYVFTILNYIGLATPNFMLALVLMWVAFDKFGVTVTGLFSPQYLDAAWSWARVGDLLSHIWLPMIVLGVAGTAQIARVVRANLLDELSKPYTEMARAKGLPEWRLVIKYPTRVAIAPVVSTLGWYFPQLLSGGLVVSVVMSLPTIGPLLLRALVGQDMYLAGTIILIFCMLAVLGALVSDILLVVLDPRIKLESA